MIYEVYSTLDGTDDRVVQGDLEDCLVAFAGEVNADPNREVQLNRIGGDGDCEFIMVWRDGRATRAEDI